MDLADKPVLSLAEQLAYFDEHAELLFERLLQEIADDRPAIIADARRRLEMGWGLYGDTGWHWTPGRLAEERRQEEADALNYMAMEARQTDKPDPWEEYTYEEGLVMFEPDSAFERAMNGGPDD